MIKTLKFIYLGKNSFNKHIQLFSLCGISALADYLMIFNKGFDIQLILLFVFQILFLFFITGYETIFLHNKSIPELDWNAFKIAIKKFPFAAFLFSLLFAVLSIIYKKYLLILFIIQIIGGIPVTMMQAGYAENYDNCGFKKYFRLFDINDYIILFFKRIVLTLGTYIMTLTVMAAIFLVLGFISFLLIQLFGTGELLSFIGYQVIIKKITIYLSSILTSYFMLIAMLVWDYELLFTKGQDNEFIENNC